MTDDFKIYTDKELQNLVDDPINLGKVKAGDTKQFTFYVYNSSINPYEELMFSVDHKEVIVVSAPTELTEKSSKEIVLEWSPAVDIKRGLKTNLKIEGFQVIG